MSFSVALSRIPRSTYLKYLKKCCVVISQDYVGEDRAIDVYAVSEDGKQMIIPMGMLAELGYSAPPRLNLPTTTVTSTKMLFSRETDPKGYRDQDVVVKTILEKWEETGVAFLAAATGFGKTTIGQHLTAKTKLKTAVLCHLGKVQGQWKDEYETFTTAKVQVVKGNKGLDPEADVYILGVQKAAKLSIDETRMVGLVILDEAHLCTEAGVTKALLNFQPRYLLGLSATPHLSAGGGLLLEKAFGGDFIYRREVKDYTVVKVETDFVPTVGYTRVGGKERMDWVGVLNSVCYNPKRWEWIADLILRILDEDPERMLLVLSQRKLQTEGVIKALATKGFTDIVWIKDNKKAPTYRVQIAGLKKAGTGYDDPSRNCGLIIDDMVNVDQYEGRIRAAGCHIYDLVDCFSTFEVHWKAREKFYRGRGATIVIEPRKNAVPKSKGKFSKGAPRTDVPTKSLF